MPAADAMARLWLSACEDVGLAEWLLRYLQALPTKASIVVNPKAGAAAASRAATAWLIAFATAAVLLKTLLMVPRGVASAQPSPGGQGSSGQPGPVLLGPDYPAVVSNALRTMTVQAPVVASIASLKGRTDALDCRGAAAQAACVAAGFAHACGQYAEALFNTVLEHTRRNSAPPSPAAFMCLAEPIATTDLLPALAEAILKCPEPIRNSRTQALLERLWAHAGMEPEGGAEAGPGSEWWLLLLEEGGRLMGLGQASDGDTCAQVESYHCLVAITALSVRRLRLWSKLRTAGVAPATPMAARLTQVSARTAEALCRLCRGEGLGGGNGTPVWLVPRTLNLARTLAAPCGDAPSPEAMPFCLEAAAWWLRLVVEGTAAELEGRVGPQLGCDGNKYGLVQLLQGPSMAMFPALRVLISVLEQDSVSWSCDARRTDALDRLWRAGLVASLDHATRLSFAAADWVAAAPEERHRHVTASLLARSWGIVGDALLLVPVDLAALAWGDDVPAGVLVTLAKRAAATAKRLGALAAKGSLEAPTNAEVEVEVGQVLKGMHGALSYLQGFTAWALKAAGAASSAQHKAFTARAAWALDVTAYVLRSGCLFATQATAVALSSLPPPPANQPGEQAHRAPALGLRSPTHVKVVGHCLRLLALTCKRQEQCATLQPQQVLSLQPHRLLAAACKLLCGHTPRDGGGGAWGGNEELMELCTQLLGALVALAAHPALSGRVRVWLTPAGEAAAADAGPGAEAAGEAEAGCLEALLRCGVVPRILERSRDDAAFLLLLLLMASGGRCDWLAADACQGDPAEQAPSVGEEAQCDCGDSDCPWCGEGGSAFRQAASSLDLWLQLPVFFAEGSSGSRLERADLQFGSHSASRLPGLYMAYLQAQKEATGRSTEDEEADLAALVAAPLPPLLAAPLALPRLRVCGHPGCKSFGGRCEAELPLLLCAGCRCVRYCCREHQRQHWRREHKHECGALAAAAAAREEASVAGMEASAK
ncbi:hypothetical protein HYH03_005474 [Edaphochlamys debaryana]|uniref:MYND-type domain-containing protein n=1 Tax=Edaphochlamys debaryana TaxID=47281 RepID=A0A835YFI3_9CHLO|nr:hypothetical protein HYH03_005474 [Edaphochlamys debaryana]|eukprot:KAG2496654.1 hypothetical protein HYH03_005474 [Edaphochlamys debaryana]